MTPIMRWRWELLPGRDGHVYHAVEPVSPTPGAVPVWIAACRGTGTESVLELDGEERCRTCIQLLAKPEP